jgi:hypothetical protein
VRYTIGPWNTPRSPERLKFRVGAHGLRALSTQFKPKKWGGTATWQLWGIIHTPKRVQLDYIMGCKMMQGVTACSTVWAPSIHMYGYHQDHACVMAKITLTLHKQRKISPPNRKFAIINKSGEEGAAKDRQACLIASLPPLGMYADWPAKGAARKGRRKVAVDSDRSSAARSRRERGGWDALYLPARAVRSDPPARAQSCPRKGSAKRPHRGQGSGIVTLSLF